MLVRKIIEETFPSLLKELKVPFLAHMAFLDTGTFSHAAGGGEQNKVGIVDFTQVQHGDRQ